MATVRLDTLKKRYPNGFEAVHGVSVDIAEGEFIVIVGPSGCGKSTLLRMVAGLETITEGDLYIDDQRVNDREPGERDIAMVFQNYALYPHMSVFDNMAYGLRNRKTPRAEIDTKVREAAEILHLSPLLKSRPSELSGGQRQRVAMGRAIVRSPKVFLFDEPLSNLDAKLRVQMRIEIKRLQRELGTTTIYVTHDQVEAMTLADRLIAMNAGMTEQVGTPLDLYNRPATRFVAGFIGSPPVNFIPARVRNGDLVLGDGRTLPVAGLDGIANAEVTLGVRPEHFEVGDATDTPFRGIVEFVEALGAETLVYVRLANLDEAPTVIVRQLGTHGISEGDEIGLDYLASEVGIFDADGQRLEL